MAEARNRAPRRNLPVVVNLISDDDDDADGSFSGDDAIMANLAARPATRPVKLPRSPVVEQRANRPRAPDSVIDLDSPSPRPQPPARLLQRQAPRFEPLRRHHHGQPHVFHQEPPGAFLDSEESDSEYDSSDDEDSDVPFPRPPLVAPPHRDNPDVARPAQAVENFNDFDYGAGEDLDEEAIIAHIIQEDLAGRNLPAGQAVHPAVPLQPVSSAHGLQQPVPEVVESVDEVLRTVATVFPGICLDFVTDLFEKQAKSADRLIAHILDKNEKGTPWPRAKDKRKGQKRKREPDEDERDILKYGAANRGIGGGRPLADGLRKVIRDIISQEFKQTPMTFIDATLAQSGYRLFPAYRVLEEAERTFDDANPVYNKIRPRKVANFSESRVDRMQNASGVPADRTDILDELVAARRVRRKAEEKREVERQAQLAEEENTAQAERDGTMGECGCCYGDYPLNRMVHCSSRDEHLFCKECSVKNAETVVGNSKYELTCMSMDGCEAGFSMEQRSQFLTATTIVALERNEQEAVLRMAGIENLASCPFCPYAAEYPPIEENKEFQCKRPECEKVSCRLCNLESHIPKSCEESAKENGLSIRREIEEAMTAALIRRCNKCDTPFIKEEGCNKMTCSRPGCRNIQCYVCSKSCGYEHFDDRSRGGRSGNCPLFENVEQRHEQEVKEAEKAALAKVRAEHPEYTEEDLRVKMSEDVQKDDERRRGNDPRAHLMARMQQPFQGGINLVDLQRVPPRIPRPDILAPNGNFGDEVFREYIGRVPGMVQGAPPPARAVNLDPNFQDRRPDAEGFIALIHRQRREIDDRLERLQNAAPNVLRGQARLVDRQDHPRHIPPAAVVPPPVRPAPPPDQYPRRPAAEMLQRAHEVGRERALDAARMRYEARAQIIRNIEQQHARLGARAPPPSPVLRRQQAPAVENRAGALPDRRQPPRANQQHEVFEIFD